MKVTLENEKDNVVKVNITNRELREKIKNENVTVITSKTDIDSFFFLFIPSNA